MAYSAIIDAYLDAIWYFANRVQGHWWSTWYAAEGANAAAWYNTVLVIEEVYYDLEDIINWIYGDLRGRIDSIQGVSKSYVDGQVSSLRSYTNSEVDRLEAYISNLGSAFDSELQSALDQAADYTDTVAYGVELWVQGKLGELYNAVNGALSILRGDFKAADQAIYQVIDQVVDAIYTDLEALAISAGDYINDQVADVKAELEGEIATVEQLAGAQIEALSQDFDSFRDETAQQIDLLSTSLQNQISEKITLVNASITELHDQVTASIKQVSDEVDARISETTEQLRAEMVTLAETLGANIRDVQADFEAQMALLSDFSLYAYNYSRQGFDLPELGLFNLILRSDDAFESVKGYLKLLLARILAA